MLKTRLIACFSAREIRKCHDNCLMISSVGWKCAKEKRRRIGCQGKSWSKSKSERIKSNLIIQIKITNQRCRHVDKRCRRHHRQRHRHQPPSLPGKCQEKARRKPGESLAESGKHHRRRQEIYIFKIEWRHKPPQSKRHATRAIMKSTINKINEHKKWKPQTNNGNTWSI